MKQLTKEHMMMIVMTHEMGFAEEGPPQEIFHTPSDPRTQNFLRKLLEERSQ